MNNDFVSQNSKEEMNDAKQVCLCIIKCDTVGNCSKWTLNWFTPISLDQSQNDVKHDWNLDDVMQRLKEYDISLVCTIIDCRKLFFVNTIVVRHQFKKQNPWSW